MRILVLVFALTIACATALRSQLPDDARCYAASSIIWPLGADTGAGSGSGSGSGSWLILLARRYSDSTRRLAAYAVDTSGNTYGGSWQRLGGDSVEASLRDELTVTRLRLVEKHDGLIGSAHGISDEMKRDSSGVSVPFEYDWSARFKRVRCAAVPDSLLKHVDAA